MNDQSGETNKKPIEGLITHPIQAPGDPLKDQYISECLAQQAEVFAKRKTPVSGLLTEHTVAQCIEMSNPYMNPDGSIYHRLGHD